MDGMDDADDDRTTHLSPADFARVQAELERLAPPNEHLKRAYRTWKEVRPQVVTSEERVAAYGAEMEAAIARYRDIAASLPPAEDTPGSMEQLVAEMDDWAPYRRAANEELLGDED